MRQLPKNRGLPALIIGSGAFAEGDSLTFAGECVIQQKWFNTTVYSVREPFYAETGDVGIGSAKIDFGSQFVDYFAVAQIQHGGGFPDRIAINFGWKRLAGDSMKKGSGSTSLKSIESGKQIHFNQTLNKAMKIDNDLYDIVVHCSGSVQ